MNYAICINNIQITAKKQGISMKFLCDQLGKRRTFLSEVRLGKDRIHDSELDKIAAILHTTPEYLKGETDDPSPAESEWVDEIKKDPVKAELMAKLSELDVETLLKVEKILDMIKDQK